MKAQFARPQGDFMTNKCRELSTNPTIISNFQKYYPAL